MGAVSLRRMTAVQGQVKDLIQWLTCFQFISSFYCPKVRQLSITTCRNTFSISLGTFAVDGRHVGIAQYQKMVVSSSIETPVAIAHH